MVPEQIKDKMREVKNRLFQEARAVRETGEALLPVVGALMPDGNVPMWHLGEGFEGPLFAALLYQEAAKIRGMGAVAAVFFADTDFEPDNPSGESGHSLVCYLTADHWEELWAWKYQENADGEQEWEEKPEAESKFLNNMNFSPFPQWKVNHREVH